MNSEKDEKDQSAQEVLYWAVAIVGLIALKQLWTEMLRPWIEGTWGDLRAGEHITLPIVGRVDQAEVIGVMLLAVPLLIALGALVGKVRRQNRHRIAEVGPSACQEGRRRSLAD